MFKNLNSQCKTQNYKAKIPQLAMVPVAMVCSTIVENIRQIGLFFAKQSQFSKKSNRCKANCNKGL